MQVKKISGVTGVILAGGASSRMGSNKALLLHRGGRIIEGIYRTLANIFEEVIIVTGTPQLYNFLPCRKVPDVYVGKGVPGGIHSGLVHSKNLAIFAAACDMPHLNEEFIRYLCSLSGSADLVIPSTCSGFEPLHSIYRRGCLSALEEILKGETGRRVTDIMSQVRVRKVLLKEIALFDPEFKTFDNINTPEEYFRFRCSTIKPPGADLIMHMKS